MIDSIKPLYFYEKCIKCGYRQIRSVSCTTYFVACPKCDGKMGIVKRVSKPNIGSHVWISVLNVVDKFEAIIKKQ